MTELRIIKDTLLKKKADLHKPGITEIGVFGSYIRGEATPCSDIDILIELKRPVKLDLLDLITIEQELRDELKTSVNLVIKSSLSPIIKKSVLSEVQYI